MPDEKKEPKEKAPSPLQQAESQYRIRATQWVVDRTDNATCPFCGWQSNANPDEGERNAWLEGHIKEKHLTLLILAYQQQSLDPDLREEDPNMTIHEALGIDVTDELDKWDYLYVPKELRLEVKRAGDQLRWVAPEKVQHWLDQGAVQVPRGTREMPHQASTEDSTMRANEMVLLRLSSQLVQRRRANVERKTDNQLAARREELHKLRGDMAEAAYNYAVHRGYDKTQAMNVAKAFENLNLPPGEPRVGITVRDKHGTHT